MGFVFILAQVSSIRNEGMGTVRYLDLYKHSFFLNYLFSFLYSLVLAYIFTFWYWRV